MGRKQAVRVSGRQLFRAVSSFCTAAADRGGGYRRMGRDGKGEDGGRQEEVLAGCLPCLRRRWAAGALPTCSPFGRYAAPLATSYLMCIEASAWSWGTFLPARLVHVVLLHWFCFFLWVQGNETPQGGEGCSGEAGLLDTAVWPP